MAACYIAVAIFYLLHTVTAQLATHVDAGKYTGIHDAAWRGDLGLIIEMVEAGSPVDLQTGTGATPLYAAVRNGQFEAMELLVRLGANVDKRETKFKGTALLQAAAAGQDLSIITLLDLGADITATNIYGNTALHMAAQEGHPRAVQVLLDHGADIHTRDNNGNSPLHDAAWSGQSNTVEVLLKAGASPFKLDRQGTTPLVDAEQRSKENGDYDGTIRLLKEAMQQQNVNNTGKPSAKPEAPCTCTPFTDCLEVSNANAQHCKSFEVCCNRKQPNTETEILLGSSVSSSASGPLCTLPSGSSGQCLPLDQCREQYEQVLAMLSTRQFLQNFGCTNTNADNLGVRVCCPSQ